MTEEEYSRLPQLAQLPVYDRGTEQATSFVGTHPGYITIHESDDFNVAREHLSQPNCSASCTIRDPSENGPSKYTVVYTMRNQRLHLIEEVKILREKCLNAAEIQYAAETPLYRANFMLGLPAAILAGVASVTAFAQVAGGVVAGLVSLVVAALSGALTYIDPFSSASQHHRCAKGNEELYHTLGHLQRYQLADPSCDIDARESEFAELQSRFSDLNNASGPIGGWAYRTAKKKIKEGNTETNRDQLDE